MKKFPILGIAILLLSLVSCKKAYKCECTTSSNGDSIVTTRDISKTTKKRLKPFAEITLKQKRIHL
jgi:hypothetical protein